MHARVRTARTYNARMHAYMYEIYKHCTSAQKRMRRIIPRVLKVDQNCLFFLVLIYVNVAQK